MTANHRTPQLLFAGTIFLSAFLLFQVQPLIGKYILPWFGGSPSVWTVCMLFFQTLLFGGYAYAHGLTRLRSVGRQARIHAGLLGASLFWLPIAPAERWRTAGAGDPTWHILLLLAASIGLPYLVLSATGPLLQSWYARVWPQESPYRLYALSNLGSLLALLSYPFVFEPAFGVDQQAVAWSWLFGGFWLGCVLCAGSAWRASRTAPEPDVRQPSAAGAAAVTAVSRGDLGRWFLLAFLPSLMLLAVTNQICTDLAVMPFLWIMPLTLYLISFILCFHSLRWCPRWPWALGWALAVIASVPVMYRGLGVVTSLPILLQMTVYFSLLLSSAMFCHGELARGKPDPQHLTAYYLTMAAGGAAGGVFVGLVGPLVFPIYAELSLGLLAVSAMMLYVLYRDPGWRSRWARPRLAWAALLANWLVILAVQVDLFRSTLSGVQSIHRNFFGVLQVKLLPVDSNGTEFQGRLIHGRTMHGLQFTSEEKQLWPTSYYSEASGAGLVLKQHRAGQSRHIGVVGLGVGTLATYGQASDRLRFYEINPAVIDLAEHFFTYLPRCRAPWDIVLGDARVSLQAESPQQFDVLVLDAFSSDAIPLHLLTEEAFSLYLKHLKPDGILAVHISNVHLDLYPVVAGHADSFRLAKTTVHSSSDAARGVTTATWTLLSRDPATLQLQIAETALQNESDQRLHWTDDRNSLFEVLRRRELTL